MPKLSKSELAILRALDAANDDKVASVDLLRHAADLTPRGIWTVIHRMDARRLIARTDVHPASFALTFKGMKRLAEQVSS